MAYMPYFWPILHSVISPTIAYIRRLVQLHLQPLRDLLDQQHVRLLEPHLEMALALQRLLHLPEEPHRQAPLAEELQQLRALLRP